MKSILSRTAIAVVFMTMLLLVGGRVSADDQITVTVVNTTGQAAADLHVFFSGAGGNIVVDPIAVVAPGCPIPIVPSNPPTITSTAVIDWGTACVAPGASVTFLAVTMNGPLSVDSACWTDTLGMFIDCADTVITGPGPGPGPQFGAIKVQVRCRPRVPPIYIGWFAPGVVSPTCWARWCCWPITDYYYRVIYCPFATRLARFLEFPPWIPLTGWRKDGTVGPRYFWQFQTWPPPPDSVLPKGPPPEIPLVEGVPAPPWAHDLEVRNSDDSGKTFRPAADFATSFFDVYYHIQFDTEILTDTTPNFQQQLQMHAPGYQRAAQSLDPLRFELQQISLLEPNTLTPQLEIEVEIIQLSLAGMAVPFAVGQVGDPLTYEAARNAFNNLAAQLAPLSPRYANAADNLQSIAEGFDACFQAVLADPGMVDPIQQDIFRWGLFNRFQLNLPSLATGTMPHVRVQVDLGDHKWFPATYDHNVLIITQPEATCELDTSYVPLSDFGQFDVVSLSDISRAAGIMRLWFKVPGYLSHQLDFMANDGDNVGPIPLIPGDVNGDNHVDDLDSAQVANEQGDGGLFATSVPPSDVNGDGIVDSDDLDIVVANMNQWGDPFAPLPSCATGCCVGIRGDVNGDGSVNPNILDLNFLVNYIFRLSGDPGPCLDESNVNGDGAVNPNILDLNYIVNYIFRFGPLPPLCP